MDRKERTERIKNEQKREDYGIKNGQKKENGKDYE